MAWETQVHCHWLRPLLHHTWWQSVCSWHRPNRTQKSHWIQPPERCRPPMHYDAQRHPHCHRPVQWNPYLSPQSMPWQYLHQGFTKSAAAYFVLYTSPAGFWFYLYITLVQRLWVYLFTVGKYTVVFSHSEHGQQKKLTIHSGWNDACIWPWTPPTIFAMALQRNL